MDESAIFPGKTCTCSNSNSTLLYLVQFSCCRAIFPQIALSSMCNYVEVEDGPSVNSLKLSARMYERVIVVTLSVYLSVCVSVSLSVCQSVCLFVCQSVADLEDC